MTKLVPLKCSVCGANLSRDTLICEYCGTHYVLSEESVAIRPKTTYVLEPKTTYVSEPESYEEITEEDMQIAGELFRLTIFTSINSSFKYYIDDRVDRKILRYLKETAERKYDAAKSKLEEYESERVKLKRLLNSGKIDEDAYDDQCKELWKKYEMARDQILNMLDCRQALEKVYDFIFKSVKEKSGVARNIKSIDRLIFSSVDGKISESSFIYKITGILDCSVGGLFSTQPAKKHFSAEVDYKTGEIVSFTWEPQDSLNVQEYRARPLPLPKFVV